TRARRIRARHRRRRTSGCRRWRRRTPRSRRTPRRHYGGPRLGAVTTASEKAHALLDGVRKLDDEWARAIGGLGEPELRAPSALPGWSRAHVLPHVARNADGLKNLL